MAPKKSLFGYKERCHKKIKGSVDICRCCEVDIGIIGILRNE